MKLGKRSKYQDELNEAHYVITRGLLPHKIPSANPFKFIAILRHALRKNNFSDGTTTSVDPDKDGVWVNRRK